ncbi:hypothetical protein [Victivallis vadensis]|uniref:Uncharacterized protein n=1 Tax=Victivallis vadensis TaxID=172901 RepID=A0A2U1B6G7_9BACT|nr:hypothetical protein [Victivallis vadensis]PVY44260.1 hypothetical protein C8D82_10715 [Victivallis vadensis]
MSIKAKISLDSSELKKGLNSAEQSVKKTGQEMSNATKKLDNFGDNADRAVRAIDSVGGALGQASTGISGLAGDLIDLVKNPMSAAIAAITALVAVGVKLWDKLTMSAEEYAQKASFEFEQAQKKFSDLTNEQKEDTGYLDRLKQISQEENISNAVKAEAISIIQSLTDRYGDLGISIDLTTGKIIGLEQGMTKANQRMLEFSKEAKKLELNKAENVADSKIGLISKGKRLNSGFTPADFGGKSFGTSMAHRWAGYDVSNKGGIEDLATSFLSSNKIKDMAKQVLDLREKMKETNDPEALKILQAKEDGMKRLIRLQLKLEVAEKMASQTAGDAELSQKWRDASLAIQELILKQKEYNNLTREGDKTGTISPEEIANHTAKVSKTQSDTEAQRQRQKQYSEDADTLRENQRIEDVSGGDKLKKVEQKIKVVADLKIESQNTLKDLEQKLVPVQQKINDLLKKQKDGVITPEETKELLSLTEESANLNLKIETCKANIKKHELEEIKLAQEKDAIEKERKKYIDDMVSALDNESSILSLRLKGLDEEAAKLELINQLKGKGIELSNEDLQKIMDKKKALGGLKLQDYFQNQNESLDIQEKKANGQGKEALRLEILRNAEKIKGGKLTEEEIKNAERLADRQWKLQNRSGKSESNGYKQTLNIRGELTNDLARRGGFTSSVVSDPMRSINQQLLQIQKSQNNILSNINGKMDSIGVIR